MESLATGVNEAGLAIGRYKYSWLTDHPLVWDAAVDAVADLNDGISEDAGWMVFEAWGVNGTGQVIGFGTAVVVGIYHQRGYLLTPRPTAGLGPAATVSAPNAETLSAGPPVDRWVDLAWCAVLTEVEEPTESLAPAAPEPGSICLWVPVIRSPHATCAYSWISPPTRSRRRIVGSRGG